jgi:ribosomal-protein-alanine N-acetyltransferase
MIEVQTERLRLRPLTEADRAEFVRIRRVSEAHLKPWIPEQTETLDQIFSQELEKNGNPSRYLRMGGELSDGSLVGFFNLGEIVRGVFQSAYAGWSLSAASLGRGYATEGVRALLDLAFSVNQGLGLHRVEANIIPVNARSIRLASRLGMRFEGRSERYLKIAGRWQDHLRYAKTVEEHQLRYLP